MIMAKDLPYFKFYVSEWSDGDVTLESLHVQGLFTNLCSYYWSNDCDITLTKAAKKFREATRDDFDCLVESGIIKVEDDQISINFLDEQKVERLAKSKTNSTNGALGGRPKKEILTQNKPTALISLSETKGNKKRREERRGEEKRKEEIQTKKNSVYPFIDFWELYDKKVSKDKAEKLWANLSETDQKEILDYIPKYKIAQPEKKYRKSPDTFLRNKSWQDELIESEQKGLFGSPQVTKPQSRPTDVF